MGGSTVA